LDEFQAKLIDQLNRVPEGDIKGKDLQVVAPPFNERDPGKFITKWKGSGGSQEPLKYLKLKCSCCLCEIWYSYTLSEARVPVNI
jgi:hypothetical protein